MGMVSTSIMLNLKHHVRSRVADLLNIEEMSRNEQKTKDKYDAVWTPGIESAAFEGARAAGMVSSKAMPVAN